MKSVKKTRGRPKGINQSKKVSNSEVSNMIRAGRLNLKLGLKDVANMVGLSVQFLSNIEHGRAPLPMPYIKKVCTALNLSEGKLTRAIVDQILQVRMS